MKQGCSALGCFNIARYLPEMAARQPDAMALALPIGTLKNGGVRYRSVSYRQLDAESDAVAHALVHAGLRRGMPTALMVKPGPDFFALTFAMAKVGAVPVIVDPAIGLKNIKTCLEEAQPEAFVGLPSAHAARFVLGWGKKSLQHLVTVGRYAPFGGITLNTAKKRCKKGLGAYVPAPTKRDERAAILFTSGSTGVPKGAVYTHGNFEAQVETLRRVSKVGVGEIDMPTLPIFALFDPALGMSTIVPKMDATAPAKVNPNHLVSAIQQFGVTNLFASPAVLNVLARHAMASNVRLPTLKRVVCAGAPVQPAIMDRCLSMMASGGRIVTPYGATEALPVCAVDSNEILTEDVRARTAAGGGVLVGQPVDEVRVSIIRILDEAIDTWDDSLLVENGKIGEIVVEGAMVTASYQGREASTKLAKIPIKDGFLHRMGDVGYLDERGRLWFCGRKSHRVEVDGSTLFSVPCEMIFNAHPLVYRTALVRIEVEGAARAALCVQLEPEAKSAFKKMRNKSPSLHAFVRKELLLLGARFESTKTIQHVFFHRDFPVDIRHNAKIDRDQLGAWATKRL